MNNNERQYIISNEKTTFAWCNEETLINYYKNINKDTNKDIFSNLSIVCGLFKLTDRISEMLSQNKYIKLLTLNYINSVQISDIDVICSNLLRIFKRNKTIKKLEIIYTTYLLYNLDETKLNIFLNNLIKILHINTSIKELYIVSIELEKFKLDTNMEIKTEINKFSLTTCYLNDNIRFVVDIIRYSRNLKYLVLELLENEKNKTSEDNLKIIYRTIVNKTTIKTIKFTIFNTSIRCYKVFFNNFGIYIKNYSSKKIEILLNILSKNKYKELILNISRDYKQKRVKK